MNSYQFIQLCVAFFMLIVTVSAGGEIASNKGVYRVIDGDTIEHKGEKLRLFGVDTPELKTRCEIEKRHALEAKKQLDAMLKNGYKVVTYHKDKYGRTVADLVINDTPVTDILVRKGLGRVYPMRLKKERLNHLKSLETLAKKEKLGIWK